VNVFTLQRTETLTASERDDRLLIELSSIPAELKSRSLYYGSLVM